MINIIAFPLLNVLKITPPELPWPPLSGWMNVIVLFFNIVGEELWWRGYILPRQELTFQVWREALEALVKLLNPMAPHIAEELWQILGNDTSLQLQTWPAAQPEALMESAFTLVVQVDGKLRGKIVVPVSATDEELKNWALNDPSVQKWLKGEPRRVILAKRKLVNIVT